MRQRLLAVPAAALGGIGREQSLRRICAVVGVLAVLWPLAGCGGIEAVADEADAGTTSHTTQHRGARATDRSTARDGEQGKGDRATHPRGRSEKSPRDKPEPAPAPRTWLVTRIIDGDTIELGNGAAVRVVGIDTPERGECGYDTATANMSRLVLGKQVRLTISDEDTDRYGRWLRYVDVGQIDAGLRQIKDGFAIARYDSRDGYGYHRREPVYVRADRARRDVGCPRPAAPAAPATPHPAGSSSACAAGYSPCVPPYPPDVDCADVDGPVRVTGTDPHGLDADHDGVACE